MRENHCQSGFARLGLINWLFAAGIALVLSASLLLDGPFIDDHSADWIEADALSQSILSQAEYKRFARAAQAICGNNAAWADLGGGTVQCLTHRGYKTTVAQVQP